MNRVLTFSGEFLAYMCHLASETPAMYERIREVQTTIMGVFDLQK